MYYFWFSSSSSFEVSVVMPWCKSPKDFTRMGIDSRLSITQNSCPEDLSDGSDGTPEGSSLGWLLGCPSIEVVEGKRI